jgi:hypothetical protein
MLWSETKECMAAAKEPITVRRPDGSTYELPCDVRARASVIREGRGVLDLLGQVTGELRPGGEPQSVTLIKVISLPKCDEVEPLIVERTRAHLDAPKQPLALPMASEDLEAEIKSLWDEILRRSRHAKGKIVLRAPDGRDIDVGPQNAGVDDSEE